jgi:hypothetical protein
MTWNVDDTYRGKTVLPVLDVQFGQPGIQESKTGLGNGLDPGAKTESIPGSRIGDQEPGNFTRDPLRDDRSINYSVGPSLDKRICERVLDAHIAAPFLAG